MKKVVIVIIVLIILFLAGFGILYLLTRPEVPPLPALEEATTAAAFDASDRRTVEYEGALFTVPADWLIEGRTGGLCLTPPGESENGVRIEYYPENDFAGCGTGLNVMSVILLDGVKATKGYYDGSDVWSYICAENGYVMINNGLTGENADIAQSVMLTMKVKGANGTSDVPAASELKIYDTKELSPELAWVGWNEENYQKMFSLAKKNRYYPMNSKQALPTAVITSFAELEKFKKNAGETFQLDTPFSNENGEYKSFSQITEKCDEKFFEKNALLVTYISESTGSASPALESAGLLGNELEMYIKSDIPEVYTCDMAGWFLCTVFPIEDVTGVEYINSWK